MLEVVLTMVSFIVVSLAFIGLLVTIAGVVIMVKLWKRYDMTYRVQCIYNELKYRLRRFRA